MLMSLRSVWLLILLPACALLGPGASGDDDDYVDDNHVDSVSRSGPSVVTTSVMPATNTAAPAKTYWSCTQLLDQCNCTGGPSPSTLGARCDGTLNCCLSTSDKTCQCM